MNSDLRVFAWKGISQSLPIFHSNLLLFQHPQSLKANDVDSTKFEGLLESTLTFKSLPHILCWLQVQANIWHWSCLWANFSPAYLCISDWKVNHCLPKWYLAEPFGTWHVSNKPFKVPTWWKEGEASDPPPTEKIETMFYDDWKFNIEIMYSVHQNREAMSICNLQHITNCKKLSTIKWDRRCKMKKSTLIRILLSRFLMS